MTQNIMRLYGWYGWELYTDGGNIMVAAGFARMKTAATLDVIELARLRNIDLSNVANRLARLYGPDRGRWFITTAGANYDVRDWETGLASSRTR